MNKVEIYNELSGMASDFGEARAFNKVAYSNHNIRFTDLNKNLVMVNEKGTEQVYESTGTIIGCVKVDDTRVVIFVKDDIDKIIELTITDDEVSSKTLYEGNLGFDVNHEIHGVVFNVGKSGIYKIMWVDGYNPTRFLISDNIKPDWDSQFNILPDIPKWSPKNVTIRKNETGGSFVAGTIQYYFTAVRKGGQESNVIYVSDIYYISGKKALAPNKVSSNSFTLKWPKITKWDYVKIYSVQYTELNNTPIINSIGIFDSSITSVNDTGNLGTSESSETLRFPSYNIKAKDIVSYDDRVFLSNFSLMKDDSVLDINIDESKTFKDYISTINDNIQPKEVSFNTDSLKYSYSEITTLKTNESYLLGIQFQYADGTWTDPIKLEEYTPVTPIKNGATGRKKYVPSLNLQNLQSVKDWAKETFIGVRPLIVFPKKNKEIITQGILSPTVFNIYQRYVNQIFSQASWIFRPDPSKTNINKNFKNLPLPEFRHYYPIPDNHFNNAEIQNISQPIMIASENYDPSDVFKNDWLIQCNSAYFYVDRSIMTLNSPETDWDSFFGNLNLNNYKLRIVGWADPSGFVASTFLNASSPKASDIQIVTPSRGLFDKGLNGTYKTENVALPSKGYTTTTYYDDILGKQVNLKNNSHLTFYKNQTVWYNPRYYKTLTLDDCWLEQDETVTNKPQLYWGVYMWHRYKDLRWHKTENNEEDTYSKIVRKVMHNHHYANTHYYDFGKEISVRDSKFVDSANDTPVSLNVGKDSIYYYGNVNTQTTAGISYTNYVDSYNTIWPSSNEKLQDTNAVIWNDSKGQNYPISVERYWAIQQLSSDELNYAKITRYIGKDSDFASYNKNDSASVSSWAYLKSKNDKGYPVVTKKQDNFNEYNPDEWTLFTQGKIKFEEYEPSSLFSSKSDDLHYSTLPVNIKYKSNSHVVCSLNKYIKDNTGYQDYVLANDKAPMAFKSTIYPKYQCSKHFGYDKVNLEYSDLSLNSGYIIAELYHDVNNKFSADSFDSNYWSIAGPVIRNFDSDIEWVYGDTFFNKYDCLKTYSFTEEDMQSAQTILTLNLESSINTLGVYSTANDIDINYSLSNTNYNQINKVYSQLNTFESVVNSDKYDLLSYIQPNSITWSQKADHTTIIDEVCKNLGVNSLALQSKYGNISFIEDINNNLYIFQPNAISRLTYNERATTTSAEGAPILLASNNNIENIIYLYTELGCDSKQKTCKYLNNIYFIDTNSSDLYKFSGQDNKDLALTLGCHTIYNQDFAKIRDGKLKLHYNTKNLECYTSANIGSLAFSDITNSFTSWYDYNYMDFYESLGSGNYLFINKDNKFYCHKQFGGDYNYFYGEFKPFSIELLSNPEPFGDKVFDTLDFVADSYNTDNELLSFDTFDKISAKTEYQFGESDLEYKKYGNSPLKKKFRFWHVNIPRNSEVIKGRIKDRIRNPWAYIKLEKAKENNYKTVIQELQLRYTL